MVSWRTESNGGKFIELRLEKATEVSSKLPGGEDVEHGVVNTITLVYNT